MTVRQFLEQKLHEHGLFEDEAKTIVEKFEGHDLGEAMKGRLDDDIEGYPGHLKSALWMNIKSVTVEWIDENKPQHWARPMFAEA